MRGMGGIPPYYGGLGGSLPYITNCLTGLAGTLRADLTPTLLLSEILLRFLKPPFPHPLIGKLIQLILTGSLISL